jgi:hypothetical protein
MTAKPVVKQGRKATDLMQIAGLQFEDWRKEVFQKSTVIKIVKL